MATVSQHVIFRNDTCCPDQSQTDTLSRFRPEKHERERLAGHVKVKLTIKVSGDSHTFVPRARLP